MNLRATATFRAGDLSRIESLLVPRIIEAVTVGTQAVFDESQVLVAVDTGELKASGSQAVEWKGQKVTGTIVYSAEHAAFVEFGTGIRGSESAGAGPVAYNPTWPGMPAQPYIRPALDAKQGEIKEAFAAQGFKP